MNRKFKLTIGILAIALIGVHVAENATSQETSLLHQTYTGPVARPFVESAQPNSVQQSYYPDSANSSVGINSASWTFQPPPPLRSFKIHDIVTLRVDEIGRMLAQGNAQKRRNGQFSATLSDWLQLSNFTLGPAEQRDGDPTVAFDSEDSNRNQAIVETRESLTFNIAATIVDIRPNGNLVLEARKSIRVNDNIWETSLSGTCRAIDVAPDNVVLSKDVLDLEIQKEDQGQLRDGYRRGWFTRWFDRLQPF